MATVGGVLEIVLINAPVDGAITVLSAAQLGGNFTQVRVTDSTGGACALSAEQRISATSVLVLIDSQGAGCGGKPSSRSRKKYVIAGAVAGAVLVGIACGVVLWFLRKRFLAHRLFHESEGEWVVN